MAFFNGGRQHTISSDDKPSGWKGVLKTCSRLITHHRLSVLASSPSTPPPHPHLNCRLSWLPFSNKTGSLDVKVHVNAGEANRKESRLAGGKKKEVRNGFEVVRHVSRLLLSDLPIWANNTLTWSHAELGYSRRRECSSQKIGKNYTASSTKNEFLQL